MFNINSDHEGIRAILKPHQEHTLALLVQAENEKEYLGSRDVWEKTNAVLGSQGLQHRSRATYINYLSDLADNGFVFVQNVTGKGGHRDLYQAPPGGIEALHAMIATEIIRKTIVAFPLVDMNKVFNALSGLV